jgi:hypothetical protein
MSFHVQASFGCLIHTLKNFGTIPPILLTPPQTTAMKPKIKPYIFVAGE